MSKSAWHLVPPPPRVMARARLRALIASMLVAAFFSACSDEGVKERPPQYNLCDSDADCSELTPRCIGLDLSASGKITKTCVQECDPHERFVAQCPYPEHPSGPARIFLCVGINESGHLDPTSTKGVCSRVCGDPGPSSEYQPEHCPPLASDEGGRTEFMVCARMAYDEWVPSQLFCLEGDVPLPAPLEPRYQDCDSAEDCSQSTPECRKTAYKTQVARPANLCTRSCETDEDCPIDEHTSEGPIRGRCLGLSASGEIDLNSSDKVCFPGCSATLIGCLIGAGSSSERFGGCRPVDPEEQNEEFGWYCF